MAKADRKNKRIVRPTPARILKSIHDIRCANLLSLVGEGKRFTSNKELAGALGLSDGSYISQLTGPSTCKRFTESAARKFEYKLKLPMGWLDTPLNSTK